MLDGERSSPPRLDIVIQIPPVRAGEGTQLGEYGAIRHARHRAGLTLAQIGDLTGYSASQVSRFERGLAPLTDIAVLRRFSIALSIPPQTFGLTAQPAPGEAGHERAFTATCGRSVAAAPTVTGEPGWDGDDPVRRRQLLTNLAVTAAAAAGAAIGGSTVGASEDTPGDLLISQVRDAMLGLSPAPTEGPITFLQAELAAALADFSICATGGWLIGSRA